MEQGEKNFLRHWVDRHIEGRVDDALLAKVADQIAMSAADAKIPLLGVRSIANALTDLIVKELTLAGSGSGDPLVRFRGIQYVNGGTRETVEVIGTWEAEFRAPSETSLRGHERNTGTDKGEPGDRGSLNPHPEKKPETKKEVNIEAELDEVDRVALRRIAASDKVVGDIVNMQEWAEELTNAMGKAVKGPVKVAVAFFEAQIETWGAANKLLEKTKVAATCKMINEQATMAEGDNRNGARDFWDTIGRIRGCE